MLKVKKKDLTILAYLRKNARITLTNLSRKSGIPVSTLFDKLKNTTSFVHKYTALVDFQPLGFATRAIIVVKMGKNHREEMREFLEQNKSVNTAHKINNGYDYMLDVVFKDMKELEDFLEYLDSKFKIEKRQVFYILEHVKEEEFLSSQEYVDYLFPG